MKTGATECSEDRDYLNVVKTGATECSEDMDYLNEDGLLTDFASPPHQLVYNSFVPSSIFLTRSENS